MMIKITSYELINRNNVTVASLNDGFLYLVLIDAYPPLDSCYITTNSYGDYLVVAYDEDDNLTYSHMAVKKI